MQPATKMGPAIVLAHLIGAAFVRDHIIRVIDRAFDVCVGNASDAAQAPPMLGLA
jgi:hypothetical protein